MDSRRTWTTSILSCSLLVLGACGDDSTGTGSGTASTSADGTTTDTPNTTNASVDTTEGPMATSTTDPTNGMDTTAAQESTGMPPGGAISFRLNSLSLTDPNAGLGGDCGGDNALVNGLLSDGVTMDADGDGNLDSGFVLVFSDLDQSDGASGTLDFANAACAAPAGDSCSLLPMSQLYAATYNVTQDGVCLEPDPAVADTAAVGTTNGPCFGTEMADVVVVTSSFSLPLSDARIAAQFVGDPAGNLVSGTMSGFLSQADADNTQIDFMGIPLALGNLLCGADADTGGWWMHMSFTAVTTTWNG